MHFKYKAPPIVAKFMKDNAHMRVIMGPQGPVSGDTEFLTPRGWKRIDAYAAGDELAEWDSENGCLFFREPLEYHVKPSETFLYFRNEHSLSMMLSDEHRVPCYDWKNKFQVISASQLAAKPSRTRIPTTFFTTARGINLTLAEIRLAVAQYADGFIDSSKATVITVRKERKKKRLRELLRTLDLPFTERVCKGRPAETRFRFRWEHTDKRFASYWYDATAVQLATVMDEVCHWDGMIRGGEKVYYSRYKSDADFIQYVAHALGGRGSISRRQYTRKNWNDSYAVHIAGSASPKAKVIVRRDNTLIERVPSQDGKKYCFTTNTGFFVARHKDKIFITGNSGKSSGSCVELLRRSVDRKPDSDGVRRAKFVVVRNTVPMLRDTTIPTFLRWFPHGTLGTWHMTDKYYHFRFGDVDSQILFRALDDADDVAKLLSSEYTGCYFNELREIDPVIYEAMTKRVGRWVTDPTWTQKEIDDSWYGIWGDTNPPQVGSWLHKMMEKEVANNWAIFKQPSGRSPEAENADHLRSDYYNTDGLSEEYIRVMIDGEYGYDQSGLPVFGKTFIPSYHATGEELRVLVGGQFPITIGIDAGLTPAAVVAQMDYRGRLLVVGECCVSPGEAMGMERFVQTRLVPYLHNKFPMQGKMSVIADPAIMHRSQANEVTPYDILVKYFNVTLAFTDKLPARINAAESMFSGQVDGKPRLVLGPDTVMLQKALAHHYRYAKKKNTGSLSDEIKDLPEKNHPWSDLADAFMYLCMFAGGGNAAAYQAPVREVKVVSAAGWT